MSAGDRRGRSTRGARRRARSPAEPARYAVTREDVFVVHRLETERAQLADAGVELFSGEWTGWRDDGDRGLRAGAPVACACGYANLRHFGGDRLVLVAAEHRAQRRPFKRHGGRGCDREKPLLHPPMARQRVLDACQRQRSCSTARMTASSAATCCS